VAGGQSDRSGSGPPKGGTGVSRREVTVSGHPVRYEIAGKGDPVVLVHGLSGSTRWWNRNVPDLAEHYRVYLVNLPGFGALRRSGPRFVLAEATSWLLAWMEAVGLESAHLVGHSMGGYLSLRLAARRPEAVGRLVLVDPFLPVLVRDALHAGPFTLLRTARDLLAEDVRDDLRRVEAPTLLVWGKRDPLIPPSIGDVMRAEIPDSRLLVIERAGHNPMFDRAEDFNRALLAFLAGEPVGK
jgi:pimeloyl-ACP methyl ester carboxylesterase